MADVEESIRNNTELAPVYAGQKQLRPSIETAMHSVLRHRVVIHVHSANTIAWAVRLDGTIRLSERLAGLTEGGTMDEHNVTVSIMAAILLAKGPPTEKDLEVAARTAESCMN